jgi:ACS family D-galactonate transporter-like MFS transporter
MFVKAEKYHKGSKQCMGKPANGMTVSGQVTKSTRVRLRMLLLIFVSVVINYMDRSNISIVAPVLSKELDLDSIRMGLIFSAFGWTYMSFQIPGGWLVDKIRPRVLYPSMMGAWSVVTSLQALVQGFVGLFSMRLAMGILEAPSFPTNNKVVTTWFPERERARAISFYTSGQFVGLAFLTPILVFIQDAFGWRGMLFITGLIGLAWSVVWYFFYRDSKESSLANAEELDYIREGGGLADRVGGKQPSGGARLNFNWGQLKVILTTRNMWGVFIGHTCITTTLWFFLTWFPTYLVRYRHMGFIKMGLWASVPFIAAFVGVLCSGQISDAIVRRGADIGTARKIPVISGLLLSMSIVGANYVQDQSLIMLFMTLAFLGNGLSSIGWTFVSAMAPAGMIGLTGGIYNFIGNSSAIFVPIIIGYLVRNGNFEPAIVFISCCALVGVFSFLFLVTDVKRIDLA